MKSYLAWAKSLSISDTQGGHGRPAVEPDHEERPGHEHGSDHRRDDTHDQCHRKAFDRPGTELKEEERGQHSTHVRVDDGVHGMAKALVDRQTHRLAVDQL